MTPILTSAVPLLPSHVQCTTEVMIVATPEQRRVPAAVYFISNLFPPSLLLCHVKGPFTPCESIAFVFASAISLRILIVYSSENSTTQKKPVTTPKEFP